MKTNNVMIKILFAMILSFNLHAGKEAGDGEVVIVKEGSSYEVASRHFIAADYDEYKLSKDMVKFVDKLLDQAIRKIYTGSILDSKELNLFKKSIYGNLREFRLVDKIDKDCRSYEKHELPTKYMLLDAACTSDKITYLDRNILNRIDALNLALILVHEGIHSYNGTYSHEFIADIIRALHTVETKFKIRRPLTKKEYLTKEEGRAITKFSMRMLQLLNQNGETNDLKVTKDGILLFRGAEFEIGSDGTTRIAPGVSFYSGKFLITNSTLVGTSLGKYPSSFDEDRNKPTQMITDSTLIDSGIKSDDYNMEIIKSEVLNSKLLLIVKLNESNVNGCKSSEKFVATNATCLNSNFDSVELVDSSIANSTYLGSLNLTNNSKVNNLQFTQQDLKNWQYHYSWGKIGAILDNTVLENSKVHFSGRKGTLKNSTVLDSTIVTTSEDIFLANIRLTDDSNLFFKEPSGRSEKLPESGGNNMNHIKIEMQNSSYKGGHFFSNDSNPKITFINTNINVDGIAFNTKVEIRNTTINEDRGGYRILKGLEFLKRNTYSIDSKGEEYCYIHSGTIFDSDNKTVRKSNRFPNGSCD